MWYGIMGNKTLSDKESSVKFCWVYPVVAYKSKQFITAISKFVY